MKSDEELGITFCVEDIIFEDDFRSDKDFEEMKSKTSVVVTALGRDFNSENWFKQVQFKNLDDQEKTIKIASDVLLDQVKTFEILAKHGLSSKYLNNKLYKYLLASEPDERVQATCCRCKK